MNPKIEKIIKVHKLASTKLTTNISEISMSLKKLQGYLSYCVQKEIELHNEQLSKEDRKLVDRIIRDVKQILTTQSRILASIEIETKAMKGV